MKVLALALCFAALPAVADELPLEVPSLYDVTGVAAGDVLNIRSLPDESSEIVGALAPDARGVEVVDFSRESSWALVNSGEGSGWVAARFLTQAGAPAGANGLPVGFSCSGTEPFWSVTFEGDGLTITTPNPDLGLDGFHAITFFAPDPGFDAPWSVGRLIQWENAGAASTARILPGQCSDGMSDRAYGLHFVDETLGYGCCSLSQ